MSKLTFFLMVDLDPDFFRMLLVDTLGQMRMTDFTSTCGGLNEGSIFILSRLLKKVLPDSMSLTKYDFTLGLMWVISN